MITKKDVAYIAHLARIYLEDHELEQLTKDLEKILDYVGQLEKLNIAEIPPTSHALALKNVFREDAVRPSLPQADVLKLTQFKQKGSFQVPQVIE